MLKFFRKVLPEKGVYCLATPYPNGGYQHYPQDTIEEFVGLAEKLSKTGKNVYFAVGSLKEHFITEEVKGKQKKRYRVGSNIKELKSLIADIDCGEKKDYPSQTEAAHALKAFIDTVGLPTPTIVSSGYGWHVYWPLTESVPADDWHIVALKLKVVAGALGLKLDNSRTSDRTSVLRVPGTFNFKKETPKPVQVVKEGVATPITVLEGLLDDVINQQNLNVPTPRMPPSPFDNIPSNVFDSDPVDGEQVYQRCAVMAELRDVGGYCEEPLWYKGLQIVRFFKDQDYRIISTGHPGFNEAQMLDKIQQLDNGNIGPTLCENFQALRPEMCAACPEDVKSPVVLGKVSSRKSILPSLPSSPSEPDIKPDVVSDDTPTIVDDELNLPDVEPDIAPNTPTIAPPERVDISAIDDMEELEGIIDNLTPEFSEGLMTWPYICRENGIYVDVDGGETCISHQQFYPLDRVWDEHEQAERVLVKVFTVHDGPRHFIVSGYNIVEPAAFLSLMAKNGVQAEIGQDEHMRQYMKSYLIALQKKAAAEKHHAQLGWSMNRDTFVLPNISYHQEDDPKESGVSKHLQEATRYMTKSGTLEEWKKVINTYARPGYEAYAFGHLIGYASLLINFTKYNGAIVNFVGDGGSGKTTILQTINTLFGHPEYTMLTKRDTTNALMNRLGMFNSICPTLDEITNITPEDLSDFCYSVTQGRDKLRLDRNSEEKANNSHWKLILASSSNTNLMQKLSSGKLNAEAESLRIFEYYVNTSGQQLTKEEAMQAFDPLADNYGHAGEIFVDYVIKNQDRVKELIAAYTKIFDKRANVPIRERYWSAIVGCSLAGGTIARSLGLCNFDIAKLLDWSIDKILDMRGVIKDNNSDGMSLLVNFLNLNVGSTLIIEGGTGSNPAYVNHESLPRQKLIIRAEIDRKLTYIDANALKTWFVQRSYDLNSLKKDLKDMGALLETRTMKNLSKGCSTISTGSSACWLLDTSHVDLAGLDRPKLTIMKVNKIEKILEGEG